MYTHIDTQTLGNTVYTQTNGGQKLKFRKIYKNTVRVLLFFHPRKDKARDV